MTTNGGYGEAGYGELATSRTQHTVALGGDRPAIVTPDAVGLDVEVATVGSRGAAYLVDLVAFLTVLFVLTVAQAILGGAGFVPGWLAIAILLVLAFAWQFGYPIGFETLWRGRTPGKALLGLRVVTVEGAPIGVRHASVRAVIGIFELLGTLGAPAIVSSLISSRSQRLGDLAAGTMVVRERRAAGTPVANVFAPPRGLEAYVRQLDVSAIGPNDYATIRATLRRAQELPRSIGEQVTADLAGALLGRVTPAPPPACGPWDFLACIAAAVQARRTPSAPAAPVAPMGPTGQGGPRGYGGPTVQGGPRGQGGAAGQGGPRGQAGAVGPVPGHAVPAPTQQEQQQPDDRTDPAPHDPSGFRPPS